MQQQQQRLIGKQRKGHAVDVNCSKVVKHFYPIRFNKFLPNALKHEKFSAESVPRWKRKKKQEKKMVPKKVHWEIYDQRQINSIDKFHDLQCNTTAMQHSGQYSRAL